MNIPHPMTITPEQAIEAIAAWNEVPTSEIDQLVEEQKPPGTSTEHARVQFVYGYMWRRWQDWYDMELQNVEMDQLVLENAEKLKD